MTLRCSTLATFLHLLANSLMMGKVSGLEWILQILQAIVGGFSEARTMGEHTPMWQHQRTRGLQE
ncbi:hypothetical protein AL532_17950 [Pseudomonas monteilii]|nr:hypothetical protein AL532_17950 [Pseudomonas monteilii]